ncbi:hypothetical protein [Microbacterium esteraromaticum]|uniref:hypothetical protein n=1 Tax=Microbacterium esteraromaticum TaxID=57043 RepID=UPI0019D3CD7D|nr:hypothetical protein [Microbacterium esteraromaticum]MBN7792563.1 hypothetical protein [Microbacterium esteraromaticum]
MAARGSRGAQQRARTEAERARLYAARTAWHEKLLRRKHRDNLIAVSAGTLIVAGAIVSQTLLGMSATPAPADPGTTPSPAATTPASPTPTPTPEQSTDE